MPDSKGELKRYREQFEKETSTSLMWDNWAIVKYRDWLESALSTAEQRIEELSAELKMNNLFADEMREKYEDAKEVITALRAEREKELREAFIAGVDACNAYYGDQDAGAAEWKPMIEGALAAFLAQKEGK